MHTKRFEHFLIKTMILILSLNQSYANTTINHIERLFNDTILSTDHRYRPTLNQSEPIRVHMSLIYLSLVDVDEVHQSMSSNVLLSVTWLDEIRLWNPEEYGGLTKVHPDPLDIWRPRLFLSNSISERDMFEDDYAPLTIFSTGLTQWLPGGIMYTFCTMKMTHFPFDSQTCTLNFTTGENAKDLHLLVESSKINSSHYHINGEWFLDASDAQSLLVDNKFNVKFTLKINRISSFTLINVVIPVNIISSLSSLTFIMPSDSGERVSFSITVLLSLTVYTGEISKDLPTNSESLPLLIIYLTCLLLHSGFGIVANILMLIKHYAPEPAHQTDDDHTFGGISDPKKCYSSEFRGVPEFNKSSVSHEKSSSSKKNQFNRKFDRSNANKTKVSNIKIQNAQFTKNKQVGISSGGYIEKDKVVDRNDKNTNNEMNRLKLAASRVLTYISFNDFVLFLLFFALWFVVTVVFMALMAYGSF